MYAVIETGGKQYRVEVGTELAVELLDAEPGEEITLDRVLLVADADEAAIGRPVVAGASVAAKVLRRDRADKVIVFKYKPKARTRVKKGHRQDQTIILITDVRLNGKSAAADAAAARSAKAEAAHEAEAAAAEQASRDAALAAVLAEKVEAAATATPETEAPRTSGRARAKAAPPEVEAPTEVEAPPEVEARAVVEAPPEVEAEADTPEADAGDTADAEAPAAPKRARAPKKED